MIKQYRFAALFALLIIVFIPTTTQAQSSCTSVTVSNQTELNAAVTDYNTNCGDGDVLTVELAGGTITYTTSSVSLNNSTTAKLVIQNGTIDGNRDVAERKIFRVNPGNLVFENILVTNVRDVNGGALRIDAGGSGTLINTTMTDIEGSSGGVILNHGSLTLINSTIAHNKMTGSTTGAVWIRGDGFTPSFTMINSVVSDTTYEGDAVIGVDYADVYCTSDSGFDNTYSAGLSNLIGVVRQDNGANCGGAGTDFMTGDAQLGTLADNGGIVQTIAPLAGSPIVNAGNDTAALDSTGAALTTDARGAGFARINGAAVDLGAYEVQGCVSVTATNQTELKAATADYNANCGNDDVLTVELAGGTITYTSSATDLNNSTTAKLVIQNGTIDGNRDVADRKIFRVNPGNLVFENMLVTNGRNVNGGAIRIDAGGSATLINTTMTDIEGSSGGVILNHGSLTLINSTIAHNKMTGSTTGAVWNRGAGSTPSFTMINSVVADTTYEGDAVIGVDYADVYCTSDSGFDNTYSAGLSNLIGVVRQDNGANCGGAGTDFMTGDAQLGILADNGGIVQTILPTFGSPAIDTGNNTEATNAGLTTDARGETRIQGAAVDLGAAETSPAACQNDTVSTEYELGQAMTAFNENCGNSDTMSITVSDTITLSRALPAVDNATTAALTITEGTLDGASAYQILLIADGTLTLDTMTLQNGAGTTGGAVQNSGETVTITNSTVAGNSAGSNGGGIYNDGTLTVSSSTLSGNDAGGDGGGIYNNGTLTISDSTLSGNGASGDGGGVYNNDTLTISNSIIANSPTGGDCFDNGTLQNDGFNLVEDNSCGFSGGSDPVLGPLADNGGATWTHALLPDSPAIDAGESDLSSDQRGVSRPQGTADDIGAFEIVQYDLTVNKDGTGAGEVASTVAGIACGITCTHPFPSGKVVTLTHTADVSSTFTGWSGACSGTGSCAVTMDVAKSVTATFTLNQYTLTTASDGNGSGMVDVTPIGGVYDHGTVVTVTQAADMNSNFSGWSGVCSGLGDCVVMMDAAKSVTATFTLIQYALTTATDGTGSGVITLNPDGGVYDIGTVVTVTQAADTGSTFNGWSGACSGTGSCIVTMDAAKSVTATFTLEQYALTTDTDGTGSGSITLTPMGGVYDYGTVVTVTQSADAGSVFSGWSGACSGAGSCIVTTDAAKSVTATFMLEPYALTTATDGTGSGSIILTPAGGVYEPGTVVTVTQEADVGSTFNGWSGACSGTGSCIVTMDAAKSVTATFTLEQYALTTATDGTGSGSITLTPAGGVYDYGAVVTVTHTADVGSVFNGWSGACSGTDSCVITMDAAKSVTATFDIIAFRLFLPVVVSE